MPNKQSWYDKSGKPLKSLHEWSKLHADNEYRTVGRDRTPNDKYFVSTVWLGIDHSFGLEKVPIIFETMVFSIGKDKKIDFADVEMARYATESEAKAGHKTMLEKWSKK